MSYRIMSKISGKRNIIAGAKGRNHGHGCIVGNGRARILVLGGQD